MRDQQRNLILLTDECLTYAREESGLPSVLQRAVYAIIQRIRLSVKGLELRLEDTETSPKQHFALGLRAARLLNLQCDSKWRAQSPAASLATTATRSPTESRASETQSPQGWFAWITGFGKREQEEGALAADGIPESFHLKTVLEGASIYLDPLNDGQRASWLPYPASYRKQILSDLDGLLRARGSSLSSAEASLPVPLGDVVEGAGTGLATPVSLGALRQALGSRKRRNGSPADFDREPHSATEQDRPGANPPQKWKNSIRAEEGQAGGTDSGRASRGGAGLRSRVGPLAAVKAAGVKKVDWSSGEEFESENAGSLLRFSDLFCPNQLWQLASSTAPKHLYILKPGEVEIRARCVQRPTAPSPDRGKFFPRPFPSASALDFAGGEVLPCSPTRGEQGKQTATTSAIAMTPATDGEPLPALSIVIISRRQLLAFTTFQLASLCRWLHFAIFLYQEIVSGVYAECL